jgi:hypothetical protein
MSGLSGCPREKDLTAIFAVAAQHLLRAACTTDAFRFEPLCVTFDLPHLLMAATQAHQFLRQWRLGWPGLRFLDLALDALVVGSSQAAGHSPFIV